MTIGFIAMGILFWKQIPIQMSDQRRLLLLVLGAFIYFPGVSLYLWGLVTIWSQFGVSSLLGADLYTGHQLITWVPYGIIRHSMYMGIILAAIGGLLIFQTWAMVVFLPMALMVISRAGGEEKLLEKEFGDEWQAYISKVPSWFPKFLPIDNMPGSNRMTKG
jgi:protein-S-isoprenylcysteine O-methyltransferase Ste14